MATIDDKNRIKAAFLCHAVGDALGAPLSSEKVRLPAKSCVFRYRTTTDFRDEEQLLWVKLPTILR